MHGFYDCLRAEVARDNISVTLAVLGFVQTDVSKNALRGDGTPNGIMEAGIANGAIKGEGRPAEFKGLTLRIRHAHRLPGIRTGGDDVSGDVDVKEPVAVGCVGGHQRPLDQTAPRTKWLLPSQMPPIGLESGRRPLARRPGGPHPVGRPWRSRRRAGFRQDRPGITVALDQAPQGKVLGRPLRERLEAGPGVATSW